MATSGTPDQHSRFVNTTSGHEANASGVSWAAVIGGAVVTAALSLILLSLGTGLGLSSISPWSGSGASASTVSKAAIAWLIVMQIIASAFGGYLAGRLRTKWPTVHTDEVYFRDTAHGFLSWALALVVTAAFLSSAAVSLMGRVGHAGTRGGPMSAGPGVHEGGPGPDTDGYFVDELFRSNPSNPTPSTPNGDNPGMRGEANRIFAHAMSRTDGSAADQSYLSQLVAEKTGMTSADSQKRVSDVMEEARQDEEMARKAAAHLSLWLFVALLCGAFFASHAATMGGRQRDRAKTV